DHADRPRPGSADGRPRPSHRSAPGARAGDLHGLLVDLHRPRPSRGRAAGDLRHERGGGRHRAAVLRPGRGRGPDWPAARGRPQARRTLPDFIRLLVASSEGGALHAGGEVVAGIVPACPERGLIKSVSYRDAADLPAALDGLAAVYREAAGNAWLVWVPDFDG